MQRLKKISISLCIAILLFNIVSPVLVTMAASKEPYDHNELLQYPGYGEAMYQTVVEETAYITGQYTENKDFVSKTIDEIKDYAQFWGNEFNEFVKADSLRDAIERGGGLLLTVGDWFKKLFNDYGDEYYPPEEDSSFGNGMMIVNPTCTGSGVACHGFTVKKGYTVVISGPQGKRSYVNSDGGKFYNVTCNYTSNKFDNMACTFNVADNSIATKTYPTESGAMETIKKLWTGNATGRFSDVLAVASLLGASIHWEKTTEPGVPVKPTPLPTPYDDFRRNVQEKVNNIAIPEPRPYLSCPNGTKIQMSVSGSTFLGVNGKAMIVNKDGTAHVDSAICQLNWDKPTVKYIDGRTVVETPGEGYKDVETGEQVVPDKKPTPEDGEDGEEEEEEGEDGECGTLCTLGKLSKFLLGFFDKLLDFLKKIIIPENTDFITTGFNDIKKLFDEKLSILSSLKDTMTGLFDDSQSPALEYEVNLPATGGKPMKLMDIQLMSTGIPILKKVISGIIVLFTVLYVYRKIVGGGGVMEK